MSKELEAARELVKMLEEREKSNKVELSTLKPGEVFSMVGNEFIVLKHGHIENGCTAVICKDLWEENVKFGDSRDYNKSNVKKIMDKVASEIEAEVGADNLVEHEVSLTSVDMQNEFGSCKCKVRPVTFDEAREFNNLLVNKDLPDWWWTLTPWSTEDRGYTYSIAVVSPSGRINDNNYDINGGVRPFCIFSSSIFESEE